MIMYQDDDSITKGIYFDNEGHVINYTIEVSEDEKTLTFISPPSPMTPRFRLTYTSIDRDTVNITFEIAPTGKPEAFSTYLGGTAHRKQKFDRGDIFLLASLSKMCYL